MSTFLFPNLTLPCPLCLVSGSTTDIRGADRRRYYLCDNCSLIFVDPEHHLSPEQEKAFYLNHENNIENAGYIDFLNRIVQPMLSFLTRGMRGLDYGCGPGPTLSLLLNQKGMRCDDYDPLFTDCALRTPYDFVFATECFEHFHRPGVELQRIGSLLKPRGWLGIMTERWTTPEEFANWYYTRDPTHVCFYHVNTLDYICKQYGYSSVWMDQSRVAILWRNGSATNALPAPNH